MGKGFDSIEELILALINEEPEHTSTGESLPEVSVRYCRAVLHMRGSVTIPP